MPEARTAPLCTATTCKSSTLTLAGKCLGSPAMTASQQDHGRKQRWLDSSMRRMKFMLMIMRHSIHWGNYLESCRHCPFVSCSKQCHCSCSEMVDHLQMNEVFTSQPRPEYWCPECDFRRRLSGMICHLDIKPLGKNLTKELGGVLNGSSPEFPGPETRRSSAMDVSSDGGFESPNTSDALPSNDMFGVLGMQDQQSFGLSSTQGYNFVVDPPGQSDSSPLSQLHPQRPTVYIPDQSLLAQYPQIPSAGSLGADALVMEYTPPSARSGQTLPSTFDGSPLCSEDTSPSTKHGLIHGSPIYESILQTTPITPFSAKQSVLFSSYEGFNLGQGPVHSNFGMGGFHGGIGASSPSLDTTTDFHGQFEGRSRAYSIGVPDSSTLHTSNLYKSYYAMEVPSSQPAIFGGNGSNCTSGDWQAGNVNNSSMIDPPQPDNESQHPRCTRCGWKPDRSSTRSTKNMRQAVRKHEKRNHESGNHPCRICGIIIKNRPDNLKDHVRKQHLEKFAELYPDSESKRKQAGGPSYEAQQQRRRRTRRRSAPDYNM